MPCPQNVAHALVPHAIPASTHESAEAVENRGAKTHWDSPRDLTDDYECYTAACQASGGQSKAVGAWVMTDQALHACDGHSKEAPSSVR